MKQIRHNEKTLLLMTLAIGCMALVLLWPQWRDELRAAQYLEEHLAHPACCIYSSCRDPDTGETFQAKVQTTVGGCSLVANCSVPTVVEGSCS
jgi:hypothetical protein